MAINKKDYSLYGPFKLWTIENFPFIEADFDAITNYQLYSKIVEQMRKLCENQTKLQQSQNEVIDAFNELEKYVDDYFANLDVQEEINNKLDEMAESGQLTDIIAQYLDLAGVLSFNTISDLVDAENITNGSTCYVLGDETYNDGKGAFYKIRTITSGDVVDGFNIVALNVSNTLIAERMPNYYIESLSDSVSNINTSITNINTSITNINNLLLDEKTVENLVIISDSYGVGNSAPTDPIKSFAGYLKDIFNLTDDTFYNRSYGGCGFAHVSNEKTFLTLVNECNNNLTTERKANVSHVLFAGGYNDSFNTESEVKTGITNCINRAHEVFPNAKIYVASIGWNTNNNNMNDVGRYYSDGTGNTKYGKYINNSLNILRGDLICSDHIHPNEAGYKFLAYHLANGLQTGTCTPMSNYQFLKDSSNNNLGVVQINNNNLTYEMYSTEYSYSGTANGTEISYKTLADSSMISGHGLKLFIPCIFVNSGTSRYVSGYCLMKISERVIKLEPYALNESGTNYFSFTSIRMTGGIHNIDHKFI